MNHNHTKRNGADHWWWIPTAGGVAVTAAIAAIAIVPLGGSAAIPVPVDGSGTSASHDPGGGKRDPGAWMRPCFRVQPNWNDAEGPQPRCPKPRFTGSERAAARARAPFAPPATCPSVPDPRYVGVPWYSPVDGCPDVTYWWRSLDVLP